MLLLHKRLVLTVIFFIILTTFSAQSTWIYDKEERPTCNMIERPLKCDQSKYPKGAYYQTIENYAPITGNDSLVRVLSSETSLTLSFKKKGVTMLARQCSPGCTYPNPFKYLYEKKGRWKMQGDTVMITWEYQKDTISAKWLHLTGANSYTLKYERDHRTNYPVIGCRSALIVNDRDLFIGYGN